MLSGPNLDGAATSRVATTVVMCADRRVTAINCTFGLLLGALMRHLLPNGGQVVLGGAAAGRSGMATVDEIGQEKQRLAERLARLDADRTKLAQQLEELEIAERVLARFGTLKPASPPPQSPPGQRRGRAARAAPPPPAPAVGGRRLSRAPAAQNAGGLSLSDATLQAVGAHQEGATAGEVMDYLTHRLGMSVRPNHLGIALQRHRRAGRLENRDERWFLPPSAAGAASMATAG
jgi:hypothetical protein